MKKLPHLVQMHKTHADKGLVLMTLTIDEPDDRATALRKLRDLDATGPNFLLLDADTDETTAQLERLLGFESGFIPHTALFDRGGRRVWDSAAGPMLTDEQLEKKVEELLKQ